MLRQQFLIIPNDIGYVIPPRCQHVRDGYQCVLPENHENEMHGPGCRFVGQTDGKTTTYIVRFVNFSFATFVYHDVTIIAPDGFYAIMDAMKHMTRNHKWDYLYAGIAIKYNLPDPTHNIHVDKHTSESEPYPITKAESRKPIPAASGDPSMETIRFHYCGKTETVTGKVGAWPYDCEAKERFPNDFVYYLQDGAWIHQSDLVLLPNGNYTLS
ncbi:MAG: hypothetical protein IAF02_14305 [Anaerolineae bacterium]|nr:hypothetical protein [Anaerolineae bacterium]